MSRPSNQTPKGSRKSFHCFRSLSISLSARATEDKSVRRTRLPFGDVARKGRRRTQNSSVLPKKEKATHQQRVPLGYHRERAGRSVAVRSPLLPIARRVIGTYVYCWCVSTHADRQTKPPYCSLSVPFFLSPSYLRKSSRRKRRNSRRKGRLPG